MELWRTRTFPVFLVIADVHRLFAERHFITEALKSMGIHDRSAKRE